MLSIAKGGNHTHFIGVLHFHSVYEPCRAALYHIQLKWYTRNTWWNNIRGVLSGTPICLICVAHNYSCSVHVITLLGCGVLIFGTCSTALYRLASYERVLQWENNHNNHLYLLRYTKYLNRLSAYFFTDPSGGNGSSVVVWENSSPPKSMVRETGREPTGKENWLPTGGGLGSCGDASETRLSSAKGMVKRKK